MPDKVEVIVSKSIATLRAFVASPEVTTTEEVTTKLKYSARFPAFVTMARDLARQVYGEDLAAKLLPPYTEAEVKLGQRIRKILGAKKKV